MRPIALAGACLFALLSTACGADESTPATNAPAAGEQQGDANDASSETPASAPPTDSDTTKFFTQPPAYAPPEDRASDPASAPNYAPPED